MKAIIVSLIMFASALLLTACQTMDSGGAPKQSFDIDKDIEGLSTEFNKPGIIPDYYKLTEDQRLLARNRFIAGRLALIDLNYLQYVRALTAEKQRLTVAAELANMSLGIAGTLVGGVRAKTNLAAAVTGLNGTKSTVDKEIYYEKSMDAIIGSMNAARKELLVGILKGLATTRIDDYPFEFAVVRLDEYFMAGTIKGALTFITTEAAAKEKASDIEIKGLPVLTKSNALILEGKKALWDAIPSDPALEAIARKAVTALGEDETTLKTYSDVQALLASTVDGISSKGTIQSKQDEIDRIRKAFQKAGLMK
jgi:hypothetical protein